MYQNIHCVYLYRRALCYHMVMHRYNFHDFIMFYINSIYCLLIMHLIHVLHYTNAKDEALMMDYLVNSNKGHKVNYIDNDQIR